MTDDAIRTATSSDPAVRVDKPANPILALNPVTVLTVLAATAVGTFFFGLWPTVVVTVLCFIVAAAAGKFAPFLKTWLKTIFILSVVIMVLQAFLYPGETVVYDLGWFNVTQEGLDNGIGIVTRIVGIGSLILLGVHLISVRRMTRALEQRGTSPTASYVILSSMNMIPQMGQRMETIMDAQRSRGIETDASMWVRAKAFIPTIGPLILTSIVGVEERALTLESRGFTSPNQKTSLVEIPDTGVDKTIRTLAYIGLAVALALRIYLWTQ